MAFCESCEDSDTRLLAINDSIDTTRDDWRTNAWFATFKHESGNKDTANRIRRTLRNRFSQGGVVQTIQYGYVKKPESSMDADVAKMPEAERVYEHIFTLLENGASYSEVADWLNSEGVPTGKWNRSSKWDCRMVSRLVRNTIVKGERRRNERMSKRVNKTGRRKSIKAPASQRLSRLVPHLAFIEPTRYDRLIAKLDKKNGHFARGRLLNQLDTRAGVPKKRTCWPGQHIACGICGRLFYWGGHGQAAAMMCSGVRDYKCWNVSTFHGPSAASKMAAGLLNVIQDLPDFEVAFQQEIESAARKRCSGREENLTQLQTDIRQVDYELRNVADGVARMGLSDALQKKLQELELRKGQMTAEHRELLGQSVELPLLPPIEVLKEKRAGSSQKRELCRPRISGGSCWSWCRRLRCFP